MYSTGKQTQSLLNMDYITNELEPWSTNDMKCVCPEMFNVRYPMCSANEDQTCVTDYLGYEPKPGDPIQFKRRDTRSTKQRDTEDVKERIDKVRTRRAVAFASGLRVKVNLIKIILTASQAIMLHKCFNLIMNKPCFRYCYFTGAIRILLILLQRADETNPDAANYTEAYEICEQNLASSCQASTLEDSVNGTNVTSMIEDCAMDVMVSGR